MHRFIQLLAFKGRLSRLGFWRAYLVLAVTLGVFWVGGLLGIMLVGPFAAILLVPVLFVLVGTVAISIRRLHDRGKTGLWVIPLVAFPQIVSFGVAAEATGAAPRALVGLLELVSLCLGLWGWWEIGLRRGVPVENRFGEVPVVGR